MAIKIFNKALEVDNNDIFMSTKISVEGRRGAELENLSKSVMSNLPDKTRHEMLDTIRYMLKEYPDSFPDNVVKGIWGICDELVIKSCPECDGTLGRHKSFCLKIQ